MTNDTVTKISEINLKGNILPCGWVKNLTLKNGKPDLNAAVLLADIFYWYTPTTIRDEETGEITGQKNKFRADKMQRSYTQWSELFGLSKKQVRDALSRLEDRGLITIEFRTIKTPNGTSLSNVMFLEPVPEEIEKLPM